MDISQIDKNLKIETTLTEPDIVWHDGAKAPFRLYGVHDPAAEMPYFRCPPDVAKATSQGVAGLALNTAGVRLRFATDSPYVAIHVTWPNMSRMPHMAFSGSSGFDLYRVSRGVQQFAGAFIPDVNSNTGFDSIVRLSGEMTDYVLNFPLYNAVSTVAVGIKEGCTLTAGEEEYLLDKPVLYYGSSITQGGCASRPGSSYQDILSRALNIDYRNFGFSGNCRGEGPICRYMAGIPAAAFVCDYDHNAPDPDWLEKTHYGVYEIIREAQPDVPYIMITRPTTDGYSDDYRRRLSAVEESYCKAVAAGDKNVYFINGGQFFPGDVADSCTVDNCHPTDLGFYFMAQGILPTLKYCLFGK